MIGQEKGKPAFPGETCKTPPLGSWTEQEKWVWVKICEGEEANFNKDLRYGGKSYFNILDPRDPTGWPENRILRPKFLETILLYEPYCSSIPHEGVRIKGAWFKEEIDLSNAVLDHVLWLGECIFEANVDFSELKMLCRKHEFVLKSNK